MNKAATGWVVACVLLAVLLAAGFHLATSRLTLCLLIWPENGNPEAITLDLTPQDPIAVLGLAPGDRKIAIRTCKAGTQLSDLDVSDFEIGD